MADNPGGRGSVGSPGRASGPGSRRQSASPRRGSDTGPGRGAAAGAPASPAGSPGRGGQSPGSPRGGGRGGGGRSPGRSPEGGGTSPARGSTGGNREPGENVEQENVPENAEAGAKQPGRNAEDNVSTGASPNDAHNAEFSYYCAVLRTYAPSLTREYDKVTTRLWMRKLFGPEYHPTVLKPKRNKYLLYLSITIYNDEAYGIFKQEPPCGKLPEIREIPYDTELPPAAWENEKQWIETLEEFPQEMKILECYLHDRGGCPAPDDNLAAALDAQFQFFLWLSKPYVTLLPDPEEKTVAACWIRLLCGLASEREDCLGLKEVRNDYMQALLGYVHDLRVEGPFRLMPPEGPIPPLSLLYQDCRDANDFADPAGNQAEEFLAVQRLPESGAFAYINVTGELFGNY